MLISYALEMMQAMLLKTADATLFSVDSDRVDELPPEEDSRFPYFTE